MTLRPSRSSKQRGEAGSHAASRRQYRGHSQGRHVLSVENRAVPHHTVAAQTALPQKGTHCSTVSPATVGEEPSSPRISMVSSPSLQLSPGTKLTPWGNRGREPFKLSRLYS